MAEQTLETIAAWHDFHKWADALEARGDLVVLPHNRLRITMYQFEWIAGTNMFALISHRNGWCLAVPDEADGSWNWFDLLPWEKASYQLDDDAKGLIILRSPGSAVRDGRRQFGIGLMIPAEKQVLAHLRDQRDLGVGRFVVEATGPVMRTLGPRLPLSRVTTSKKGRKGKRNG